MGHDVVSVNAGILGWTQPQYVDGEYEQLTLENLFSESVEVGMANGDKG